MVNISGGWDSKGYRFAWVVESASFRTDLAWVAEYSCLRTHLAAATWQLAAGNRTVQIVVMTLYWNIGQLRNVVLCYFFYAFTSG